ncbi:MAG: NADH-quinone oxidoreductase subunit NuoH [Planctomycetes bacterium]|jgi:NADH-quinone oxidoreductase subunit H|nr:NADH-quinone oxidoreductase subunit NuoH [Planctomycetota bacterium]
MLVLERPKVEYRGWSLTIVRLATKWGPWALALLLRFAWVIFFAVLVVLTAFVWIVGRFINPLLPWFLRDIVVVVGLLAFACIVAIIGIWAERKVSARIQSRLGPMRSGAWHGWAQSLADGLKFVQKEDLIPHSADQPLFRLAPYVTLVPAFCAYLAIPFGASWVFRDSDVGLLFVLALLAIEVLGVIMAGWASNSKWSLYGAMRAACQLVSYEIPMGLSLLVGVAAVGSLSLIDLGRAQERGWFSWLIFQDPFLFVAFFTYYIASLASCKRSPFDLPEGESELVAGFHTEYSGFRFVMFFFAEYVAMFAVSALATIIFLGGWNAPVAGWSSPWWFVIKSAFLVWVQMWFRWTLPRIRIDQVMHACVKYLLPLTLLLFLGGSAWQLYDNPAHPAFTVFANIVRAVLGLIGLGLVGLYVFGAGYGYYYRQRLVGSMVRKHLPGA